MGKAVKTLVVNRNTTVVRDHVFPVETQITGEKAYNADNSQRGPLPTTRVIPAAKNRKIVIVAEPLTDLFIGITR